MTNQWSGRFTARLLGLMAVAVVLVLGCSGKVQKVTVNGTITYKGQRLQSGILKFVGPEGAYSAAPIREDGTFTITDVVPGDVKVGVAEAPSGSARPGSPNKKTTPVDLPEKYRDPSTSGLQYTITSQTKDLTIEIK